jgi:hypothetical protein
VSAPTTLKAKGPNGNGLGPVRSWLTPLNLHWAGVGLLALVNVYLLVQMGLLWHAASGYSADAMAQQRIELKTAELAAQPLRGLDAKLARATEEADSFYARRLPTGYAEIAGELGLLTKGHNVRLTRVAYTPAVVLAGSKGELTEVRMDASLSGDYRPLVQFINSLERDKMFFVIASVTFTGQESGTVNLRMRLTTYLRGAAAAQDLPVAGTETSAGPAPGAIAQAELAGGPGR